MKISIIIEAAFPPKNLRPQCIQSSLSLGRDTLIRKQIRILENRFEQPEFIIVSGFQSKKIHEQLKNEKEIYNKNFTETNTAYNVGLGLKKAKYKRALVVLGNSVFNNQMLEVDFKKPSIIFTTKEYGEYIGCTYNDEILENMFYELPNQWAGLLYISGDSMRYLTEFCLSNKKIFLFEAINELASRFPISVVQPNKGKVVIIEYNKDIELAKKIK